MSTATLATALPLPHWLSVPEIAAYLEIDKATAYRLVKSPGFPQTKIGRLTKVREDLFLKWVERCWHAEAAQEPLKHHSP